MRLIALIAAAACGGTAPAPPAKAARTDAPAAAAPPGAAPADDLGAIHFEVTGGTPEARRAFLRGVMAIHSFWYEEAIDELSAAVAADPTFVMGHWGLAMAHSQILFHQDDVAAGRTALAKIASLDGVSPRERAWVEATRLLFTDESVLDRRIAFAGAMGALHRAYPDDDEVASFHALAIISASPEQDPNELRARGEAGAIALAVMARNPRHPGAAHYVIHAFDSPELAPIALPAAKIYASIAPAAYHARHMPAHIFARLGMWEEAMASCRSAWDASVAAVEARKRPLSNRDYHSLSWIIALAFELGQPAVAGEALAQARADIEASNSWEVRGWYTEMVRSYLQGTEEWHRVEELLAPLSRPGVEEPPAAVAHACDAPGGAPPPAAAGERPPFAVLERMSQAELRLEVAVKRRDAAAARRLRRELDAARREMRPFGERMMGAKRFAEMVAAERPIRDLARKADDAALRGDRRGRLAALRKIAVLEDARPSPEPPVLGTSIHEDIARLLMEVGRPAEARAEWEIVLAKHPNRARALRGIAATQAAPGTGQAPPAN